MKRVLPFTVFIAAAFAACAPEAFAVAAFKSTAPIDITASVSSELTLKVVLHKNDFAGAVVTAINFGELVDIGTGTLRSSPTSTTGTGAVAAFITANSHGVPYTITQTGTVLDNGAGATLPTGACTVVPVYEPLDNGGAAKPPTAVLGDKLPWFPGTTIYTSELVAPASVRTIQAYYSVTDDPAAGATTGVPLNQASGTYTGSTVITVTEI